VQSMLANKMKNALGGRVARYKRILKKSDDFSKRKVKYLKNYYFQIHNMTYFISSYVKTRESKSDKSSCGFVSVPMLE